MAGREPSPVVICSFLSCGLSTMGRDRVVRVGVTGTRAGTMAHSTAVTPAAAVAAVPASTVAAPTSPAGAGASPSAASASTSPSAAATVGPGLVRNR